MSSNDEKPNPDASVADRDAAAEGLTGLDSDNENDGRGQLKRKEKLDPTAVPRNGPHWQHDDRGAPGSAAHSRGGKGKKLFDAGDRASNASSGRTEEKWGHDKFLELSSSSDAAPERSASSKAKGRQNPHSNSAPPASAATGTDALAASERAPRHGRGAQGAVQAALSTANDSPTANGGHGVDPGDAAPSARAGRAIRGRDNSNVASSSYGSGSRGRAVNAASSSSRPVTASAAEEVLPAPVLRSRGGGISAGRGGSAPRTSEKSYSVEQASASDNEQFSSPSAPGRGGAFPPRGRGGHTSYKKVVHTAAPMAMSSPPVQTRNNRHSYDIDAPSQAQSTPEFIPSMHYNPQGALGPGFSPSAPPPYAFSSPEMQQQYAMMAAMQQQGAQGALQQYYPSQFYMQGAPASAMPPAYDGQPAMWVAPNGQMLMYNGGQMYYMQGAVAGTPGRGPKAPAFVNASPASASPADGSAALRSSSSPPPVLKPEAKPFVPPTSPQ